MSSTKRYEGIAHITDEAYKEYEDGLVALRRCIVEDVRRKLKDAGVLDQPPEGSTPRSAPVGQHRCRTRRRPRR